MIAVVFVIGALTGFIPFEAPYVAVVLGMIAVVYFGTFGVLIIKARADAVSYTHLDVYKRQPYDLVDHSRICQQKNTAAKCDQPNYDRRRSNMRRIIAHKQKE